MENVRRLEGLPTPSDRQGLALGGVELHVPALLPISEPLEVFLLPLGLVVAIGNRLVHCRVVSKESC